MSRVTLKQAFSVLALLATLSMLAPASAQAAASAPAGKAPWSGGLTWISSLWDRLAALLQPGGSTAATGATATRRTILRSCSNASAGGFTPSDGSMINPDGSPK
jgi:hypothetical protein